MLRQYPARKQKRYAECPPDKCTLSGCTNRFDDPLSDYARAPSDRCLDLFTWWRPPYGVETCTENRRHILPPTDYLLTYWMGRHYGFITEEM